MGKAEGHCKSWTLDFGMDSGLDCGLEYGMDYGLKSDNNNIILTINFYQQTVIG